MVQRKIESGFYSDRADVIRDALRLMADRDEFRRIKLERLRDALVTGEQSPLVDDYDIETLTAELDEEQRTPA
jgi:putative addiction module CopG family antidote